MKLAVLAVGHRQPDWCERGLRRVPQAHAARAAGQRHRNQGPKPVGPRPGSNCWPPKSRAFEMHLAAGSRIVVLDEKGDDLTTLKLAKRLEAWDAGWSRRGTADWRP